ncbi:MAG: hypothetical protein WCI34_00415 [Actinomycetes bacterium]
MASKMNWDRERPSGSTSAAAGQMTELAGTARKREVLRVLNYSLVDSRSPEAIKTMYAALTNDELATSRALLRGSGRAKTGPGRSAAAPRTKKPKVLSPKAEIQLRKDLIKGVRAASFEDIQDTFDRAREEFDRLDSSAMERKDTSSSIGAEKVQRANDEWAKRLENARLGRP